MVGYILGDILGEHVGYMVEVSEWRASETTAIIKLPSPRALIITHHNTHSVVHIIKSF